VTIADFNGDTYADIAVANYSSNNVSVLLGNGAGVFAAAMHYAVGTGPNAVASADFNGDGNVDLVAANSTSNNVSVLSGDGVGGFAAGIDYVVGVGPRSVTVTDFNNDGHVDIAVANMDSNNVSVLMNQFGSWVVDSTAPVITTVGSIVVGAVDLSGIPASDPYIAAFLNGAVAWDNIDGYSLVVSHDAPATFPIGNTVVTFSATDTAGNIGSATALVSVPDADGDGVLDWLDAFPNDPAASVDSDGDGHPDNWNAGATAAQIAASGLTLDGAPNDPNVWADTTAPVMTLVGSDVVQVNQNNAYNDAGALALDNVDGDLTANISVNSTVNSAVVGSYTVTYNVTDSSGNAAQIVRTVNVVLLTSPQVTTVVGSGVAGAVDGAAFVAQFNQPHGLVVDAFGNWLVADSYSHLIRRIDVNGGVTTVAGSGVAGFADGYATTAQFNEPYGMALDAAGNLYVADSGNHRIRMIDPVGNVTTLAGSGVGGFLDGNAATALFNQPNGVELDAAGNLYVADSGNHRIRMVDTYGNVTTFAGSGVAGFVDGSSATAQLNWPADLSIDGAGTLYVADTFNHAIRKIDASGNVTTLSGIGSAGFTSGAAAVAQFNLPMALATDSYGGVLVADSGNHAIRRVDAAGFVSTVAGTGILGFTDGNYVSAQFNQPAGVMVDHSGNVVVADTMNHRVRQLTAVSSVISQISNLPAGDKLTGSSQTFIWQDAGAQSYLLTVGTTVGGSDIFSSGTLAAGTTSQLVTGLPVDGTTIYVRLYTWVNGAWQTMDRSYVSSGSRIAQITTPTNGATLAATTQTFSWSDTGSDSYYLMIGSSLGTSDIDVVTLGAGTTSYTATGLPSDARTVYVRLYSLINGAWQTSDTSYVASGTAPGISIPANGSVLGGSQIFTWATSPNDMGYNVSVGTMVGASDIYDSGWLVAGTSSVNVLGLPTNGSTVYVRHSSWVNGSWQTIDTSYIASGSLASITTPVNGTTLAGRSATFSWNVSPSGEGGYYLMIGTSVGNNNVYYSGWINAGTSSLNVTNLPADGSTLYVRLSSWVNGGWQNSDSIYTASGTLAGISGPADGATLAGSAQTISWIQTPGTAGQYLIVGTAIGKNDIYAAPLSAATTSASVTGVPTNGITIYVRLYAWGNGWMQTSERSYITGP